MDWWVWMNNGDISVRGEGSSPTEFTGQNRMVGAVGKQHMIPGGKTMVLTRAGMGPLRYSQAPWRGRLWNASFLSRLLLNKLLPSVPQISRATVNIFCKVA